jgi:ribosomal protein S27E
VSLVLAVSDDAGPQRLLIRCSECGAQQANGWLPALSGLTPTGGLWFSQFCWEGTRLYYDDPERLVVCRGCGALLATPGKARLDAALSYMAAGL